IPAFAEPQRGQRVFLDADLVIKPIQGRNSRSFDAEAEAAEELCLILRQPQFLMEFALQCFQGCLTFFHRAPEATPMTGIENGRDRIALLQEVASSLCADDGGSRIGWRERAGGRQVDRERFQTMARGRYAAVVYAFSTSSTG